MKKRTKLLIILLVLLLLIGGTGYFMVRESLRPSSTSEEDTVSITIEENWYGRKVLSYLEEVGLLRNADIAYYYTRLKNIDTDFKAGTYEVSRAWDLEKLIGYLSDGNNAIQETVSIKLLEGYRIKDFAETIAENTDLSYDELISYWNDKDVLRSYMNDYPFLSEDILGDDVMYLFEGYLFPDTYEFFIHTDADEVTRKLLDNTLAVYNRYEDLFRQSEYSVHEIFTLASIIQRESGDPDDMRDVSSVFHNRLAAGMQLQSSVTVCYSLDIGINEDWTKCEITQTEHHPYNTYQVIGFPPGPICAFSEDALSAALEPSKTDYYFFIGNVCGGGETIFASTYEEQLANQERYLTCY